MHFYFPQQFFHYSLLSLSPFPQVFTYIILASLFIFLKASLKVHPIASSEQKPNPKKPQTPVFQSYKEFLSSLTTLQSCKSPASTLGNVLSTHAYKKAFLAAVKAGIFLSQASYSQPHQDEIAEWVRVLCR